LGREGKNPFYPRNLLKKERSKGPSYFEGRKVSYREKRRKAFFDCCQEWKTRPHIWARVYGRKNNLLFEEVRKERNRSLASGLTKLYKRGNPLLREKEKGLPVLAKEKENSFFNRKSGEKEKPACCSLPLQQVQDPGEISEAIKKERKKPSHPRRRKEEKKRSRSQFTPQTRARKPRRDFSIPDRRGKRERKSRPVSDDEEKKTDGEKSTPFPNERSRTRRGRYPGSS